MTAIPQEELDSFIVSVNTFSSVMYFISRISIFPVKFLDISVTNDPTDLLNSGHYKSTDSQTIRCTHSHTPDLAKALPFLSTPYGASVKLRGS